MFTNLAFNPGVYKDDSPLTAEGFFVDADKIRFVRGKAQTVGGWEIATADTLSGKCRGMHAWLDNGGQVYAGLGTHLSLNVYSDGELYDITPVTERGVLTNPFDVIDTQSIVTVNHTAHGLVVGQRVVFSNAVSVGGITPDGPYDVLSVVDLNSYTIGHTSAATSTALGGGGDVDFEYVLVLGNENGTGGSGYGTGAYGVGGYGSPSDVEYFPRTWSMANWGQNLIANPRGGGIYEWAPELTVTEVIENGGFDADANWTKGTDWSIASGVATRAAGAGSSDLEQAVTLVQGAWYLLDFDVSVYTAGTLQPKIGANDIGTSITSEGSYKRVFFSGGGGTQSLKFSADATGNFSIDDVSVRVLQTAHIIPNAPDQVSSILVTPERILVALGCDDADGNYDPLLVCWSDQEDNTEWTSTAANTAGFFKLARGGRIVSGRAGRGENYIFTDEGLYVMRFVPDPTIIYRFDHVGSSCGLIGPNAVALADGQAFWLSNSGTFYRYAGGVPQALQSPVRRYVFDNLSKVQGDKIFAFTVAAWNEVWWLYPDLRDGNECSRYVAYNYLDNTWTIGTFDRTAWLDAGLLRFPLATGLDGTVYFQEKGDSADGSSLSWRLESGLSDFGTGQTLKEIYGLIPDFEDLEGGASVSFKTRNYPNDTLQTAGPFGITTNTNKIDVRLQGRDFGALLEGNSAPAFMRMGTLRADVRQTRYTR